MPWNALVTIKSLISQSSGSLWNIYSLVTQLSAYFIVNKFNYLTTLYIHKLCGISMASTSYLTPGEFLILVLTNWFHWSLSDSKSPKDSGTLLSILANLECSRQHGLDSSSDLKFRHFFFQARVNSFKTTNYNWYHNHLHVSAFSALWRCLLIFLLSSIFNQ